MLLLITGLTWAIILALIVAIVLQHKHLRRLQMDWATLVNGLSEPGLGEQVLRQIGAIQQNSEDVAALGEELQQLRVQSERAIDRVGLVRYNPYEGMGGDFSVALALADSTGRGIVLSSLHGRSATRLYIRPLVGWESTSPLSDEEQEAIRIARDGQSAEEPGTA